MQTKRIQFETKKHDDFVDFIKTYAILCVLFGHTFSIFLDKVAYGVWAGMQVPLFILVQSFHCYKKDIFVFNLKKVIKRVMLPFFILELLTFFVALIIGRGDCIYLIYRALIGGGYGPGAYYPWIYLQIAFLLPLFGSFLRKSNKYLSLIMFLFLCEVFEIICSLIDFPDTLYRLLAIRYLFAIYLGWLWAKNGIIINKITILLAGLSLIAVIYFEYFSVNDEPLFYNTVWKYHRWPCYFFVSNGLVALLFYIWKRASRFVILRKISNSIAAASYEIFLIQMSMIYLVSPEMLRQFIDSTLLLNIIWIPFIWVVSIGSGLYLFKIKNNYQLWNTRL